MAEGGELVLREPAHTPTLAPHVQQAHGIIVNQGNVVLAGGNVNLHTHYHGQARQAVDIVEVLRLVPNLRRIHLDILSKATPGTAIWVLKTDYFLLWLETDGTLNILWGTGIPGAGKSVMASVVINELEARAAASAGSICVAYVYFRYSDVRDLTLRGVLEILVKQTTERHPDCAHLAEEAYARHLKERTQPTQAELLQLLRRFVEVKSVTFYVLDALDEAPEKLQVDIVWTLASLNVKLFITSRPLKAIEAKVTDARSFPIIAQDDDLDLHIAQEISRSRDLDDLLGADPAFKAEVVSSIKTNCGGMFLHASLQLDAVSRCTSAQDILDILADFPSEIEDVYQQTWNRILNQTTKNVQLAKTVLVWVINAARSMTIEELRHAIATHPDTHRFERKRLASAATLLTLCCGLIIVEDETKLVRLIHYSAKDTLVELLRGSFLHPQLLLATVCITHLTECGFQDAKIDTEEEYQSALDGDPLLAYACDSWSEHARQTLDLPESKRRIADFVLGCRAFPSYTVPGRTQEFDSLTPWHIFAMHPFLFSLTEPSQLGHQDIVTKRRSKTPLMLASSAGNIDVAKALLGLKETSVNLVDVDGCSALMKAANQGYEGIVKALLAHCEIQVNLVDNEGWSALMAASQDEGIVKALLAHCETQVNLVDNEGSSALMYAASRGYEVIVKALLAHCEIQVNLVDNNGWSALMYAASRGYEGIVKAFLAHCETQVNLVDDEGSSALMYAASRGDEVIVKAFIAHHEIQVNLIDDEGSSALMYAASQGYEGIVKVLLVHISKVENA